MYFQTITRFSIAKNFKEDISACLVQNYLFFIFCLHIHFKFIVNVDITNNSVDIFIIKFLGSHLKLIDCNNFLNSLAVSFFQHSHTA